MSPDAAIVVAFFVIFAAVIFVATRASKARSQAEEDELKRGASSRGWTFSSTQERGYRLYKFAGTTDGVAWEAESAKLVAGGKNRERRHIARWHGKWAPGLSAPMVAMGVPKGKEVLSFQVAQGDGFFARMAQKAVGFAFDKALDVYFGPEIGAEVDATTLKHVNEPSVPGFIFTAGNVDEAKRLLAEGLQKALLDATNSNTSVLADEKRPTLLLRPQGISLARMEEFRDVQEVEQFVRAGVGLTRAFRFGRSAT
ncbi:MAG TPA: hypothetical protein VJ691_13205 [Vicinamibacterales bacterium]|nr:hypothetical protein [Vicinamibacterales bacterium]